MESVILDSFTFSQSHFVGGLSVGLFVWLVSLMISKIAQLVKNIVW